MTALASDDFNRANESPLAAPWVLPSGTGDSDLQLNSNAVSVAPDNLNRGMYYSGPTWPDDQWSKASLTITSTGGVRQGTALYVRMASSGAATYYRFSTDHAASTNCNISRFLGGARTTVLDFTQAWTDGAVWEMWVQGPAAAARVRMFLNGSQVADATDNSTIASGAPGLGVSGNATITSWSIDNWSGGDFLSGPVLAVTRSGLRW